MAIAIVVTTDFQLKVSPGVDRHRVRASGEHCTVRYNFELPVREQLHVNLGSTSLLQNKQNFGEAGECAYPKSDTDDHGVASDKRVSERHRTLQPRGETRAGSRVRYRSETAGQPGASPAACAV